jgi:hypothetical protein
LNLCLYEGKDQNLACKGSHKEKNPYKGKYS